jgi:alanyl aminopeptidase
MRASWLVIVGVAACGSGKAPPTVKEPAPPVKAASGGAGLAGGAGAAGAAGGAAEEPRPPVLRLPGGARPLRYDVDLTIDPAREDFAGTIVAELELAAPTRVLWLNAEEIAVEAATFEAGGVTTAARAITRHKDFLGLVVERPLPAGRARLTIRYRGKAHRDDGDGIYTFQEAGAWYAVTQFEATDARQAFPCFDEPAYKVPWRLTLRTRKELVALANTPVESEQEGPAGMKTVRFAETRPLPSYLVAFAIGPFELVDAGKTRGGAPIRVVVPRGHIKEVAWPVQATRPLVELLEDYFGIPYPYEKLDMVAVPVFDGAMENPGLITFRQALVLTRPGEETLRAQQAYAGVAAHELAHQWFGDYVTPAWWDDVWLNEAFATWMGAKIVERWQPAWDLAVERVTRQAHAMGADSLDAARAIRQPVADKGDILNAFDDITYEKGAEVLSMIERWLGPDTFQRGVRAYLARHAWGNATYADFAGAMAATTGADLRPVLDSFVLQSGVPFVSVELRCGQERGKEAPPRLALAQERYRALGSKIDPRRTWHVPVCVRWGAGAASGRDCTVLAAEAAELPLSAKACPDWVLPNEASAGYYRVRPRGDLLDRLLARAPRALTPPERLGLVHDVRALVASGDVQIGAALGPVDALAKDRSRHLVEAAISLIEGLDEMVPAELRPSYERLIRRLFGARAAALGWQVQRREPDDARQLRPALLSLVAGVGRDPELGQQATALAWRWLDDRKAVDASVVPAVLAVAARRGDQRLLDRLLAEARKTSDRTERARLFDAVGAFVDPKLAAQALPSLLADQIDLREALGGLLGGLDHAATRELAYRFVADHFDTISSRLPPLYRPGLAFTIAALCDEARTAEAEQLFRPRLEKLDGGSRVLAQALEQLSLCSAGKKAQTPGVVAFLRKQ